jgi:hypothetical protein
MHKNVNGLVFYRAFWLISLTRRFLLEFPIWGYAFCLTSLIVFQMRFNINVLNQVVTLTFSFIFPTCVMRTNI